jgi:cytidylate kinase
LLANLPDQSILLPMSDKTETNSFAIAIDGPAASGKSTVARRLPERLGLIMINTGAMYRAIAWATLKKKVDVSDPEAVVAMLGEIAVTCGVKDG